MIGYSKYIIGIYNIEMFEFVLNKMFYILKLRFSILLVFLCHGLVLSQSTPEVTSTVDTTQMKIGEQIHFRIAVEVDTTTEVIFPEGQTFIPLEMVEQRPTDSVILQDKLKLIKEYALTQFDSGHYTIPTQQLMINGKAFFTDSLTIQVNNVVVDTTKQKMYDIKSLVMVDEPAGNWWIWLLIGFLVVAAIGFVVYWFIIRKKPLTEEEKIALLPPYDRALAELKKLDESRYLIQSEYKEYYTELTNIVRYYLEEDARISAMESTTDELISKIELLRDSGNLKLDNDTINQFKNVLKTADLVKFAKSRPDDSVVAGDRKTVESIVVKTKQALPEPTEEELMEQEAYVEDMVRKKKNKQIKKAVLAGGAVVVIAIGVLTYIFGFDAIKDNVFGHPNKTLLENQWVGSSYGYPSMYVETPIVLKRVENLKQDGAVGTSSNQRYTYGEIHGNFFIQLNVATYEKKEDFDAQMAIESAIARVENAGARNMIVKQEDFISPTGKEGNKVFGTLNLEDPDKGTIRNVSYVILSFVQNGGFQQLTMVYPKNDKYADRIVDQITSSIDFKTQSE